MSGLLRRLRPRRAPTAGGRDAEPSAPSGPVDAPAHGHGEPEAGADLPASPREAPERRLWDRSDGGEPDAEHRVDAPGDAEVRVLPEEPGNEPPADPRRAADLPAGLDPEELEARPEPATSRARLRRRLRYLRAAREVLLRDLGGFVLEVRRTAGDVEEDAHRQLRERKLARLLALEEELHALEAHLGAPRGTVLLREPGLGGECRACGELLGSEARYCSRCGASVEPEAQDEVEELPAAGAEHDAAPAAGAERADAPEALPDPADRNGRVTDAAPASGAVASRPEDAAAHAAAPEASDPAVPAPDDEPAARDTAATEALPAGSSPSTRPERDP